MAWRPKSEEFETRIAIEKSKDYDTMGRPGHVWVKLEGKGFELVPVPDPIAAARETRNALRQAARPAAPANENPEELIAEAGL